jgi:predicted molibdopterin-dependent oxidoreductase YjgC
LIWPWQHVLFAAPAAISTSRSMKKKSLIASPAEATRPGIKEGDTVNVRSRRAEISIQAERSTEVEQGMVFVPMHFAECPANILTDRVFDPVANIPGFKVYAVVIEN